MFTQENISDLKKKLEATKTELMRQIKELEITPEFGDETDHFEEEADEAEALGANLGVAKALRGRLNDVDHALQKIAAGGYGTCEKCAGQIELAILETDPESRFCRNCKKKG